MVMQDADIGIIEGDMVLFDVTDGRDKQGSAAYIESFVDINEILKTWGRGRGSEVS